MDHGIIMKDVCNSITLESVKQETEAVLEELLEAHPRREKSIFVIGCSSSEVVGGVIGQNSSAEIGQVIFETAYKVLKSRGVYIACQCCEHLNRALVVEEACYEHWRLTEVSVVPQLHAGGSFATAAFQTMKSPVVVERVQATGGIDIGGTLIGMHLMPVAVPFKFKHTSIGKARVAGAWCRPKLIGGERAIYR